MTTQEIKTEVGAIPSPENWANTESSVDFGDPSILFLEKSLDGKVSRGDIEPALDEYKRLNKAGIASPAELLTLSRAYPENKTDTAALSK